MNPVEVKEKLSAVLSQIQAESGLECPPLTGGTKPVGGIPKFDSKVCAIAISLLSMEIDIYIPNNVNIFVKKGTGAPRTIDQIAAFVCEQAMKWAGMERAAS